MATGHRRVCCEGRPCAKALIPEHLPNRPPNRDRGSSHLLSPPTPPGMRVRTGRFEKLRSTETGYAQPVRPGKVQHRVQKHPAVAPPATSVSRHLCRYSGRRFPGQQIRVDGFGAFPVLELNRPYPMSHPLVQFFPDSRSLRQPEVSLPPQHIDSQLCYHLLQTASARATS